MRKIMVESLSWDNILIIFIGMAFITSGLVVGHLDKGLTIWGIDMDPTAASIILILLGMIYILCGRKRNVVR